MLVTNRGSHYYDKPTKNSLSNKEVVYILKKNKNLALMH